MSEEIQHKFENTGGLQLDLEFAFLAGCKPGLGHAQLSCFDPFTGGWVLNVFVSLYIHGHSCSCMFMHECRKYLELG